MTAALLTLVAGLTGTYVVRGRSSGWTAPGWQLQRTSSRSCSPGAASCPRSRSRARRGCRAGLRRAAGIPVERLDDPRDPGGPRRLCPAAGAGRARRGSRRPDRGGHPPPASGRGGTPSRLRRRSGAGHGRGDRGPAAPDRRGRPGPLLRADCGGASRRAPARAGPHPRAPPAAGPARQGADGGAATWPGAWISQEEIRQHLEAAADDHAAAQQPPAGRSRDRGGRRSPRAEPLGSSALAVWRVQRLLDPPRTSVPSCLAAAGGLI